MLTLLRQHKPPPRRLTSTKRDPGFESHIVVDSLPCRQQSFHRVSWKSAGGCMRNVVKYSTPLRWGKWKTDPESVSVTGSPSKLNQSLPLVSPIITPSFKETSWLFCGNPDYRQTDKQTEWTTDGQKAMITRLHLGRVIIKHFFWIIRRMPSTKLINTSQRTVFPA